LQALPGKSLSEAYEHTWHWTFPMFRAIPKSDRSDRNNVLEKLIPVAENQ
jgi:hypothetical protein